MNIEDFLKKYPGKNLNDYYSYLRKNSTSNTFENINDQKENLLNINEMSDNDKIESSNDFEIKSAKSTAIYWILGGIIFINLFFRFYTVQIINLSEGEKLAEKAKRCLEYRTKDRPVFLSCQKEIREEAEKLDSVELNKYKTIIFNELNEANFESTNNSKSGFDFFKFLANSFILFFSLSYVAIIIITWIFFSEIESNFKNLILIEKKLDNILLFFKSNPDSYNRIEIFQSFASKHRLFSYDRRYCYKSLIYSGIEELISMVIILSLYIEFAIPYISEFLLTIEFTYPNLYVLLDLLLHIIIPLWFVILTLYGTKSDIVNPIKNVQNDIEHYDKMIKTNKI